jgi:hypothetical protein
VILRVFIHHYCLTYFTLQFFTKYSLALSALFKNKAFINHYASSICNKRVHTTTSKLPFLHVRCPLFIYYNFLILMTTSPRIYHLPCDSDERHVNEQRCNTPKKKPFQKVRSRVEEKKRDFLICMPTFILTFDKRKVSCCRQVD